MVRATDYLKAALNHPVRLISSPDDSLALRSMTAREELGHLFEIKLDLISVKEDITLDGLVGKPMTVQLDLAAGKMRFWNGIITRFVHAGHEGSFNLYQATLRPWLWLLTRTSDCFVHYKGDTGQTIPEVIQSVFKRYEMSDVKPSLSRSYRKWDYVVQYRETAFNFVSRLMEQEGIYYYFTHDAEKHTLVLADSVSAHAKVGGYETVPFFPPSEGGRRERDHIVSWQVSQQLDTGTVALTDFDFQRPNASLLAKLSAPPKHAHNKYEQFEYPGEYEQAKDGETYARLRLEEAQAMHMPVEGQGNARGLGVGVLFKLDGHPRADQNKEYLIASAEHRLQGPDYESLGESPGGDVYRCSFTAIESKHPFRSPRATPRPVVQGPQTATVVGPAGEEIWTDKYGRVKVQFHWDRKGKNDENSSCWVRVSQVWAGNGWGAMHIPRIGQEVVVEFLEGDPDHPLITGRVYNGLNMPPYALPANKTQSGLKSRSTPKGTAGNFNEIRFEDKKDAEQLYVQAEKDMETLVKNDQKLTVQHDRTKEVKNDETVTIGANRTETVAKNETITIQGNRTETVEKDETISVKGARTETVDKDEKITINGARVESVNKDETIAIKGQRKQTVDKDETISIKGGRSTDITKDDTLAVKGAHALNVTKGSVIDVGKVLTVTGGDEIVLKSGQASITLKKNGEIVIKGKDIIVDGSGKATVKAGGDLTLKGSKIAQN